MSAAAESNGTATTLAETVEEIIRSVYKECDRAGEKRLGRPTLVEIANQRLAPTKVSEHLVRQVKELVDAEDTSTPDLDTSDEPPVSQPASGTPAGHQPDASRPLVLWPVDAARRLAAVNERVAATLETAATPAATSETPARQSAKLWPLILIGVAPAVAIWAGWVDLGRLTGFGPVHLLPGIWNDAVINTAVTLPISVEAYAAYAFRVWLAGSYSARTTRFAKRSALGSLAVGGLAQVAYHLLSAAGFDHAPWWVTMLVACIPVGVFGLAAVLAHMARHDHQAGRQQ